MKDEEVEGCGCLLVFAIPAAIIVFALCIAALKLVARM